MLDTLIKYSPMLLVIGASVTVVSHAVFQRYAATLERFVVDAKDESPGAGGAAAVFFRRLGAFNRRFVWASFDARVRKLLIKAGEPRSYQPEDVLAMIEVGTLVGLLLGVFLVSSAKLSPTVAILSTVLGGFYPVIWLNDQVKKRQLQIIRALPYNLDLLTLSVEAGLDFTGALARVVEKGKGGPLRDELLLVLKQLKMGKTREETLKGMIARVDLPALSSFVNAVIQADRMGTSLGKVLRIQATQMRIDRTQRAEKLANEAPVKMLFPLILCIFPTVFLVLFGPIVFSFLFNGGPR